MSRKAFGSNASPAPYKRLVAFGGIAVATASQVGSDPRPFVIAVAIACTCCFASPVAYQTHLIVYGAGGYRFRDFVRVGLPLNILCLIVAVVVIPRVWAF